MGMKMNVEQLQAFLAEHFPHMTEEFIVEGVSENRATLRLPVSERNLRAGGTVNGPTMFALADVTFYLALMAMIGPLALAVTTNCSIDFMRKPAAGKDLIGKAQILKLGRVLAVGDVLIYSDGQGAPVARAGMTYSIPPK
ncbi:PaaI family thioesterase [Profundibacter sp.]|uniref:PaaI family thioesterase n=1 Tax=Profundibacter sp. TaxID=3101071 RepID=UPI003D0ACEDA